ncbi:restriction endonuclease subunit S [Leuconostoc lactis]|uniref:restriction endonuclease subunit S n=1 Tax=Leuconostoc lactis TaxID=1246 RepID=UPI001C1FF1E3|nr:restriction endonuclease subunit S [Leuconostoc lactis]MBU7537163.1 restriction endonuclease subunit S [Leuconostoc lactis]
MKTVKLSDVLIIKYGKDHKNLDNGNIPVYGSGGLMRMVDNYLYDGESVLIPRKGSLNNVQFVSGKFWTVDTLFWTIINSNLIRPKYLYYILKQLNFLSMNVGSAVPSLTASILYPIEITIPSLEIQDKILLKILPIESKIYLNKQINDNLVA